MGEPLANPRFSRHFASWIAIAGFGWIAVTGCSSIRSGTSNTTVPGGERAQIATTVPKKPGGLHAPLRVSKFAFYANIPLDADDPVFRDLEELPDQIQRELRLPASNTIVQVYLFEDQDKYEAFMRDRFPWLPSRRAYFITDQKRPGTADDLQVYTFYGEHLRTDLRHELTHALLHSVLKGVPLWLDEGLAGFFEQPLSNNGINPEHLDKFRRSPQPADLARLERIQKVEQMEKPEYREAWAWVHFMLRADSRSREVILQYLQELRENPNPGPVLPRLKTAIGEPTPMLSDYLTRLTIPTPVTNATRTTRP